MQTQLIRYRRESPLNVPLEGLVERREIPSILESVVGNNYTQPSPEQSTQITLTKSDVIGNYYDAVGIKPDQPKPELALRLVESEGVRRFLNGSEIGNLVSTAANGLYKEATKNQELAGRVFDVVKYHPKALSPGRTLKLARIAIQDELEEAKLTSGKLFAGQVYGAFLANPVEVVSNIGQAVKDSFKKLYK